ncbi:MAG: FxsA family protein [Propioniciclava sp.]
MRARWLIPAILGIGVVAEIWLLVTAVDTIGVGWTVAALVAMAVLGGLLWRRQGSKAVRSLFEPVSDASSAGRRVSDAALVVLAGGLLILPGFLSDVLALFCLLPGTRALARRGMARLARNATRPYAHQVGLIDLRMNPDTVVEGETVADADTAENHPPGPRRDDPGTIRGEIED